MPYVGWHSPEVFLSLAAGYNVTNGIALLKIGEPLEDRLRNRIAEAPS